MLWKRVRRSLLALGIVATLLAPALGGTGHTPRALAQITDTPPTTPAPNPLLPVRTVVNGSFEDAPNAPNDGLLFIEALNGPADKPRMPGWQTTHGPSGNFERGIEVWNGFFSTFKANPFDGQRMIELNNTENAAVYQDLCVAKDEDVVWSVQHRARGVDNDQTMKVTISDPSRWTGATPPDSPLYESANLPTTKGVEDPKKGEFAPNAWKQHSATWTGPTTTGTYRFSFGAVEGAIVNAAGDRSSGAGNFLDDVQLNLQPLVEFVDTNATSGTNTNGAATDGSFYLTLSVNGATAAEQTIDIAFPAAEATDIEVGKIFNGTGATSTTTGVLQANGDIRLTIPAGSYDPNDPRDYITVQVNPGPGLTGPKPGNAELKNPSAGFIIGDNKCAGDNGLDKVSVNLAPTIRNDIDQDGTRNESDPNPTVPTAVDDAVSTTPGTPVDINVLTNDDFTPGAGRSLTKTGGTGQGTSAYDAATGNLRYTPAASETTGSVTSTYQVCHTVPDPDVCADAMVTITISDAPTVNTDSTSALLCENRGGTLAAANLVTELDNGTFGTANGLANQTPSSYPYDAVAGYTYVEYGTDLRANGTYTLVANPNSTPWPDANGTILRDPDDGTTGRFLLMNGSTGTARILTQQLTNLTPNTNYEYSFWAANAFTGFGSFAASLSFTVNGQVWANTGQIPEASAATWNRFGFVFNTGASTTATVSVDLGNPAEQGRDFAIDAVTVRQCDGLATGTISGTAYTDVFPNDTRDSNESGFAGAAFQLIDTRGDTDAANDVVVADGGTTGADGTYRFTNIPIGTGYTVRHITAASTLPATVTALGTPNNLAASIPTAGSTASDRDFGFDVTDPDTDGDGNPDSTDPNRGTPTAVDDSARTLPATPVPVGVLDNDDFIAGPSISINREAGGTAGGTVTFDGAKGEMVYTPAPTETSGDVTVNYRVCFTPTAVCGSAIVTITISPDTDGDGIPDDLDPDDDNDGNPDVTDPNQKVATAVDDRGSTVPNYPVTINILGNDDFIPGAGTSLERQPGGTANGTAVFDAATGTLTYTPTVTETTGSVTLIYRGCGIASTPNGCDTAVVTIDIELDTDGDGIPDRLDDDDDNDGNPDVTDPNPLAATALDDQLTVKPETEGVVNVLDNDDFIARAETSIERVGGSGAGTVVFDPVAGTMTYTSTADEAGSTVTVDYRACHSPTGVCANATVVIAITQAGTITGVVHIDRNRNRDSHNDEQVSDVRILLTGSNGESLTTRTGSPYVFTELAAADWTVELDTSTLPHGVYVDGATSFTATTAAGGTVVRDFATNYAVVQGTVRNAAGQPLAGVEVVLIDGNGNTHRAATQTDGTYRIEGRAGDPVIEGSIQLSADIEGSPAIANSTLRGAVPTVIDLEAARAVTAAQPAPAAPAPPVVLAFTGQWHVRMALFATILMELGSALLFTNRRRFLAAGAPAGFHNC